MKILITGGCGFVGSNLAIYLTKKSSKYKIYSLDNLHRDGSKINMKRLLSFGIKNYKLDISNNNLSSLPRFDLIIDCCAETAIEDSKKIPKKVFYTNLVGTFNLLEKIKKEKSKVIFLSSSRVYSIKKLNSLIKNKKKKILPKIKIDETFSNDSPISLYGFTKLSSEMLIKEYSYMYNFKYIINRFGVISGPWQFGKVDQGFISLWVARHINKKKLSYKGYGGYGNQLRDVIHINDVCEIIYKQIRKIKSISNLTFDIGGGLKNTISLRDLTKKCQKISKNKLKIFKEKHTSLFDVPYFVSNNFKVRKYYNWKPKLSSNDIIRDIYKWLINNKKIMEKYF